MFLNDAYDNILLRKADEAPGGIAPLNYTWTAPDYDPAKFTTEMAPGTIAPQQVVITAKKPAPAPKPLAPIQIPLIQFTPAAMPALTNPWDQITARRAAVPVVGTSRVGSSLSGYLPWIIGAAAAVALLAVLAQDRKPAPKSKPRAAPRRTRATSYARRPATRRLALR